MSINRTQNTEHSYEPLHLKNKWSIRDHETKTYETETSTSWDRGRDPTNYCETETKKEVSRSRWSRDLNIPAVHCKQILSSYRARVFR